MDILPLLMASQATDAFKADVLRYAAHASAPRVTTARYAPPIKVMRVLAQLLAAEPRLEIERVSLTGHSGCSDFRGVVDVETTTGHRRFDFAWCCRWRAEQEGWTDYFGFPDQMRAAHTFGWQCFELWREQPLKGASRRGEAQPQLSLAQ